MDKIFLNILDIIYLLLYFAGIFLLRKKFITWYKIAVLRYLFVGFYISTFIPIVWIDNLVIQDKLNPCFSDVKNCLAVLIVSIAFPIIHILIFFAHIFFYFSLPSKRYLSENLSEKSAITWIKFKKIILILMFVIPIIYMIIANITLVP